MTSAFRSTNFNESLDCRDVSNVKDMSFMFKFMFKEARIFNQDIASWNVASVTNMRGMFETAESFNQNIRSWNVGNLKDMCGMFYEA
jgi:surface protein